MLLSLLLIRYYSVMQTIEINGARIAYFHAGSSHNPLALCLHGFPDTAHTWRYLVPCLVDAGWQVVCPNLRGFAPTMAPASGPAGQDILGADANALHEAFGGGQPGALIGHDWGAAAAYAAATTQPDRWSMVIASAWPPMPQCIDTASYEQMRRSWYVFFFQLQNAETIIRTNDFSLLDRLWQDWTAEGYDSVEDVKYAKESLCDPDCLRLALAHYKALFTEQQSSPIIPPISMLYIHGAQDGCIGSEIIEHSSLIAKLELGSKVVIIPEAGHFPHLEQPDIFNAEVIQTLSALSFANR